MSEALAADRWFGEFRIAAGERGQWQIGPLTLTVERGAGEWRVHQTHRSDLQAGSASVRFDGEAPGEEHAAERYIVTGSDPLLSLLPLLPDRPVIVRPLSPAIVPAGEAVRLYVSLPVWLQLAVGSAHKVLAELPSQRLSDTWFGPNTREGELCYALRSRCRLSPDDALQPHRVVVPLRIHNQAAKPLVLERIKVPVPQLSLYAEPSGRLWAGEVGLERSEDGQFAALHLEPGPPPQASKATPLAGPREPAPKKTAIRAFSGLFQ